MKILNSLAKFYRKHKKAVNIGGIIIIGCLLIYGIFGFFVENTSSPIYGNRLEGIKKVEIKKDRLKEISEELQKEAKVTEAKTSIEGKIIEATLTVEDDTSIDDAKKAASVIVSKLEQEELDFYDIEIYVNKEDESKNNFPIIGHKKAGKENISWTKNREVSE